MATPANVYSALVQYVASNLTVDCWLNREPEGTPANPRGMPYVVASGSFDREYTMGSYRDDHGHVTLSCFGRTDDEAGAVGSNALGLFDDPGTWMQIPVTPASHIIEASPEGYSLQPDDVPDQNGNVVWRCDVRLEVRLTVRYGPI